MSFPALEDEANLEAGSYHPSTEFTPTKSEVAKNAPFAQDVYCLDPLILDCGRTKRSLRSGRLAIGAIFSTLFFF